MKALRIGLLAGITGSLAMGCGSTVECPACAEGGQSPAGGDGPDPGSSTGSGAAPGTTTAASTSASTSSSASASSSATSGSGGGGAAPTEGVPCNESEPVWIGYVIPADQMAYGASDPGGPGFCEGWVWFTDGLFMTTMYDYETGEFVQAQANGSSELGDGCKSAHCGTLLHADGKAEQEMCSVYALCENDVAHSVAFDW
jgi:hypothetical protein